jgi:hypothetical protein
LGEFGRAPGAQYELANERPVHEVSPGLRRIAIKAYGLEQ